ncbi:MAG: antitoxin component YwqK of YwqJK toxin-antitoxin module [Saprospiraceae bacterium]|jgi:antitoxin component YwqK of YwqJK toxin-antitoxin module
MLKKLIRVSFLLFAIILSSCGDKTITTAYETGEKYEEYQYTGDSLKHGWYKTYSPEGVLTEKSNYINGKLDGERKIFTSDGQLEVIEQYDMDALNGGFKTYHSNGNVKLEGLYTGNVLAGIVKGYYPTGELMEEVMFEENMEQGPFKEYHTNGKLKWEGTYRKGDKEFGLLKEFNEQGELIKKMLCDSNAICTTTWKIDGTHLKK